MAEYTCFHVDEGLAHKIYIAAKKLGVEPSTFVSQVLRDWVENNKWLTLSVDEVMNSYEKALEGYSSSTKKTKIRLVKTFLEWCNSSKVVPSSQALEEFIKFLSRSYSSSYVTHARATLKDFVQWFDKTWSS